MDKKQSRLIRILEPDNFTKKGCELILKPAAGYNRLSFIGVKEAIILSELSNGIKGVFLFEGKIIGHDFDIVYNKNYLSMSVVRYCDKHSHQLSIRTLFYDKIHSVYKKI